MLQTITWRTIYVIILALIFGCSAPPVVNYTTHKMMMAPIGSAPTRDEAALFHDLFCAVLASRDTSWGDCSKYLEDPGGLRHSGASRVDLNLFPLPRNKYEVLIVPGIYASCVSGVSTLEDAADNLRGSDGLIIKIIGPEDKFSSFSSSQANEAIIESVIEEEYRLHHLPFIVVGHSKGATDTMVFLTDSAETEQAEARKNAQAKVAAFVSLSGAIGGSRQVDLIHRNLVEVVTHLLRLFGWCEPNVVPTDFGGLASLSRSTRWAFLQNLVDRRHFFQVPTYSVVAISDEATTSSGLRRVWDQLAVYEHDQDGLVIRYDAILPGTKYLGAALADHLAIALPVEDSKHDRLLQSRMDKNHYPRSILLETVLRL